MIVRVAGIALALTLAGCTATPPPPVLPDGIAQLQLTTDSASLGRLAADEARAGTLERRRAVIADLNRQVLMPPPSDDLVPELFDLVTAMAPRMESRTISPAWASYVYTTYQRDLVRDRPSGTPRRSPAQIGAAVDAYVEYFRLRARDDRPALDPAAAGMDAVQDWRTERRLGR